MKIKTVMKTIIWLVFSFTTTHAIANCDFDDFPVMDEMSIQSVMEDATYNNRPMMVRNFTADASYQSIVSHYHKLWDGRYDDTAFGIWHQVTTMTDDCMLTVQIAAGSSDPTVGRLVISNPPKAVANDVVGEDILMPTDSQVVSDLLTNDGPKNGRVTMIAASGSTGEVAQFYLTEMQNSGWSVDRTFVEQDARVLVFRDGLNTSNILIIPAGDITQVLINEEIIK